MQKRHKVRITSDDESEATETGAQVAGREGAAEAQTVAGPAQAPEAVAEPTEKRIRRLEEQLAEARQRAEETNEKYLRALADLENVRRRARQERAEAMRAGESAILLEVLPVLDNFSRAMEAAQGANDAQALVAGVKMIHDQLLQALERKGVKPIEAEGEPFDPTYHDAVGKIETTERPEGVVAVEIQKGYKLGDRVLRPSRVMVAVRPAPESGGRDSAREES
jgi:molecular chaperone GrpE